MFSDGGEAAPSWTREVAHVAQPHGTIALPGSEEGAVGEKAMLLTQSLCPRRVRISLPVVASHSFTVVSQDADAIAWVDGLNATERTQLACPTSRCSVSPVGITHTRMVASSEPDAKSSESGLQARVLTGPVCPSRVRTVRHALVSTILIAWSCVATARDWPFEENATARTWPKEIVRCRGGCSGKRRHPFLAPE